MYSCLIIATYNAVKVPDPSCRLTESGTFSTFMQQSFNANILAPCNVGFHTGPKINGNFLNELIYSV